MFKQKYYCGLDIGARQIKAGIIKIRDAMTFELVETCVHKAQGFNARGVSELEELVDCIHNTVGNLSKKTGIRLKELQIGIGGGLVNFRNTNTVIPLTERGNKVIAQRDIKKINTHAQLLGIQMEEEILHSIPQCYSIDDAGTSLNPGGLYARKLGLNSLIILANASCLNNIVRAVGQAGYDAANIFFSVYAAATVVLSEEQMEKGSVLIDIGASGTDLLIFKEGRLKYFDKIPFGGNDFTRSIAQELSLSFELAEDIKKSYAEIKGDSTFRKRGHPEEEILVKKNQAYVPVRREVIDQSVERKAVYFIKKVQESIENAGLGHEMDGGVAIIGGGAFLPGLIERFSHEMNQSVRLGGVNLEGLNDFSEAALFASAIGLAQHRFKNTLGYAVSCEEHTRWVKRIFQRAGELYEEYF